MSGGWGDNPNLTWDQWVSFDNLDDGDPVGPGPGNGLGWADASETWDGWLSWNESGTGQVLEYTDNPIDLRLVLPVSVVVNFAAQGSGVVEWRTAVDGVNWTDWAVPGNVVNCRFVQMRATVTGANPVLKYLETSVVAARVEQTLAVDTAALPQARILGVGDVRIPVRRFSRIDHVAVTFRTSAPGWSYDVADLDVARGPRVRLYDASHAPADAAIDVLIKGY
jgi:hypothetical protein